MYSVDQLSTGSIVVGVEIGNLNRKVAVKERLHQIISVTTQEVISSRKSILVR